MADERAVEDVGGGTCPRRRWWWLGGLVLLAVCAFRHPFADWILFATGSSTFSHILLVPAISLYLVSLRRDRLAGAYRPAPVLTVTLLASGAAAAVLRHRLSLAAAALPLQDSVALGVFAFVSFVLAAFCIAFGARVFRAFLFPALFLYFSVPPPHGLVDAIEIALQHGSAHAVAWLLTLTRTPYFRDDTVFMLPGLAMNVAPECSGIRSTLVLLITTLLAGYLFLQSPWRRAALAACFIPIGVFRNALRIVTVALLSIHVDMAYFEGPVHRRGGTPFFILSLAPLFLILFLLRRSERRKGASDERNTEND